MIKPIKLLPFIVSIWSMLPLHNSIHNETINECNAALMTVSLSCKTGIVVFYDIDKQGAVVYASDLYNTPATTTCTTPNSNITYYISHLSTQYKDSIVLGLNDLFTIDCLTLIAKDACGDSAMCKVMVDFLDTIPPVITCPLLRDTVYCNQAGVPAPHTFQSFINAGGTVMDETFATTMSAATLWSVLPDRSKRKGCFKEIERRYVLRDFFNNADTCSQIFNVRDTMIIKCPKDTIVPMVTGQCYSLYTPVLSLEQNCSAGATITHNGPSNNIYNPGNTTVSYTAINSCNDTARCSFVVTVRDANLPNLTCHGPLEVNLASNSNSVSVDSLIISATDNCPGTLVKRGRRMSTTPCYPMADQFGPRVGFCCNDVNNTIQVIVQVTDASNNSNTCMVSVTVRDKVKPRLVQALPDVTVSCDYNLDINDLEEFGTYVFRESDRQIIDIDDSLFQLIPGVLKDGLIDENCTPSLVELAPLDQRGPHHNGNIIRRFTVTDQSGNSLTLQQTITIIDADPLTLADIHWPEDYTYSDCNVMPPLPATSGSPTFDADDICTVPAATYTDQIFDDPTSGCIYIRRKWKVIDWAQYVPNTNLGKWEFIQDIHLINNVKPNFSSATCSNKTVCAVNGECSVRLSLGADATDDCTDTEDLAYNYSIDYGSDGTIDVTALGDTLTHVVPRGLHSVTWNVEDKCGNRRTCYFTVRAKECKAPTPICLYGLSTNLENNATSTIWAKDFNNFSNDNCTAAAELKYSFSTDVNDISKVLTCANRGNYNVTMWVTDGDGNQSKCNTFIAVTDNKLLCPTTVINDNTISIAGRIVTEEQANIKDIAVHITADGNDKQVMTDTEGNFLLNGLSMYKNYNIAPFNNNDWNNGVSTLDLVLIQRHILGNAKLSSPYKIIAADVTNDQKVSASDLVALRKLILGQVPAIENNTSWRFVSKNYTFPDPNSPWPFQEKKIVDSLFANLMDADFYAIKIGDINGTVSSAKNLNAENRENNEINVVIKDAYFEEGGYVNVPFAVDRNTVINAFQLGMITDKDVLEFRGIMSEGLTINEDDYAYNPTNGELRIINSNLKSLSMKKDAVLFTLQFKVKAPEKLSRSLNQTSFESFVWNQTEGVTDLVVRYEDDIESLIVNQNVPNPFDTYTDVNFFLADQGKVEMTIYNASGMVIYNKIIDARSGDNTLRIDKEQLDNNYGVFFLHIASGERREIRKLLRLN